MPSTDPEPGTTHTPPNHHADHPGFSGAAALVATLTIAAKPRGPERLAGELTGIGPGDRLVDIGCGPGAGCRLAARRGATAVGVDPSAQMLRLAGWATTLRPGVGRSTVEYRPGGAEHLPVDDGWATVAWSMASVHHWPELERGLAEAHRVLTPGGRFLAMERCTEPGASGLASHGWTGQQAELFASMLAGTGFDAVTHTVHQARPYRVHVVQGRRPGST